MRSADPLGSRLSTDRSPELIRARSGVYLVFLANGLGFANLVPRFPEIVEQLGLRKAAFGQAVAAASVGALVAGLAASWLISRLTSARVASLGMLVVALALLGAGLARSWIVLAGCLLVVGGTDAIVDVAQNAHGLRVQRRWGASIVTSFHAAWSLGAVLGAAMGQAAAGAGVGPGAHMMLVAVILLAISVGPLLAGWFLPGHDSEERTSDHAEVFDTSNDFNHEPPMASSRRPFPVTALVLSVVGVLCAASMFPEDVAMNWSSLLLSEQGAAAGLVGLGLVALQGTMIVGRLVGDRIIDTVGRLGWSACDPRHERLPPALLRPRNAHRNGDLRSRLRRRRTRDLLCGRRRRRSPARAGADHRVLAGPSHRPSGPTGCRLARR